MHGTLIDNDPGVGVRQRVRAFVAGVEQLAHDLLALPIWRVALTLVSFVTTTYGLMLLYNTLSGSDHANNALGFLRFVIPVSIGGGLHATIFYLLRQWAATGRAKYFVGAVPLQVLAILASFGTHWLGMLGGGATTEAFQKAIDDAQRGIGAYAASYGIVQMETTALVAHSNATARVEEKDGGNSCGYFAGNKRGPRYDLRKADQATFSQFDSDVRDRKAQIEQLVKRAEALTAGSADEAMARLGNLRNLVNEAKARIESDPLLDQIRKVAETRIITGKGPIDIAPAKRGKSGPKTFTCYDAELERRLEAVIAAIKNLKPLPEVNVPDYRNPNIGFPFALWRLAHAFGSLEFLPPSREKLSADRIQTLKGRDAQQQTQWRDVTPLAVASGIELLLVLLFYIGRDPFSRHPGMVRLAGVLERTDPAVFDPVWQALGGSANPEAMRRAIDVNSKFERYSNWVFVPLYGEDDDMRVLHILMEMLVAANMARRVYAGRGFMARWFMRGWDPARKVRLSKQAMRIYRMTAREYAAFVLDALNRRYDEIQFANKSSGQEYTGMHQGCAPGSTEGQTGTAAKDRDGFAKAA